MSSSLSKGLKDPFLGLILGLALPPIIMSFLAIYGLTQYIWIYHLVSIGITLYAILQEIPKWRTSYSFGWLIGTLIIIYTGLGTIIDILTCILLIGFLIFRGLKWTRII